MQRRLRTFGVVLLICGLDVSIGVANSAFHWHSILPFYALTLVLLLGVAAAAILQRNEPT